MLENKDEIVTIKEMMELLNIGKNTAYRLLENGDIKAFRIGNRWKISLKAVYKYISQNINIKN